MAKKKAVAKKNPTAKKKPDAKKAPTVKKKAIKKKAVKKKATVKKAAIKKKAAAKKKPASRVAGRGKKAAANSSTAAGRKEKAAQPTRAKSTDGVDAARAKLQSLFEKPKTEQKVLRLLLGLDEKQRRELSSMCQAAYREARKNNPIQDPPGTFRQNPLLPAARLAVFCTGSFTEIKKLGRWGIPNSDLILEVIAARDPDWVEPFVELLLSRSYYWNDWRLCRELVRRGFCKKPDNPRYYTGMITGLRGRWNRGKATALGELRKDPDLLKDEIWRLFEYEGDGDNTLANVDRFDKSDWSGALVALSKEGKLPRGKLLDSAIGALQLGFNHYRARWFFTFFDLMEPTNKELKKRADKILDLIGSPTPNVAQWAFDKQQRMLELGLVKDASKVITASAPLLGGRHKKTVMQVLVLYRQLAEHSPQAAREVCLAAAEALSHEKADVQKAAFKLIDDLGSPNDQQLREAVQKYLSVAAATLKKQLKAWLAGGEGEDEAERQEQAKRPSEESAKTSAGSKPAVSDSDLKQFDPRHVELLNLKPLVAASQAPPSPTTPIPAARFNGTDIPRLDADRKLTPIVDLDELLETLGRVIEDDSLIDDAERAVEGLARLHHEKPEDFDQRIAPLAKRADNLLRRRWSPFSGQGVVGDMCGLICAWKRGEPVTTEVKDNEWGNKRLFVSGIVDEPIETWHQGSVPLAFMSRRMLDVCGLLTGNESVQLLSAPTHEGGWIVAEVLVERINGLTREPAETDVVLALLRLAPDNRSAALNQLKPKLKGEWLLAVKHGLGASGVRIGKTAPLWAAAARCRAPLDDDPKVAKAFPELGPGAGKAARFETSFRQTKTEYGPSREFKIQTTDKLPGRASSQIPTQLIHLNRDDETTVSFHDIGTTNGSIRWLATMWPAARESFFASGAISIGENLDWWEAEWHNRCFLEPLLDSDAPLLDMGEILLLCGLAAKEPGEHGLAVDIAIQAVLDGRVGTDNLGRMLATGLTSGHFNLPRLAKRLQEIANASDLHAYLVMHATETALSHVKSDDLPRGIGDVCELLLELGTQMQRGIDDPACRSFLSSLSGSNKTAKAARQLLAIESHFDPRHAIETAIQNRIERLQQWAARN